MAESRETQPRNSSTQDPEARMRKVARFSWIVLFYNLAVIVWGAFVRASGSGAGCGRHWPLCNGEVVPTPKSIATVIEAGHRVTSGLAVVAVVLLLIASRIAFPKGHRVRRGAAYSTFFIFTEALVGAGLVLFELVAHDASMKRGLSMILHLSNTFFLLAALSLTAWWATNREESKSGPGERAMTSPALLRGVIGLSLTFVMVLGASGAIAALGDTLFPSSSLREGLAQDLSPMAHAFLRLRLLHPVIALTTGVLVLGAAGVVRAMSTSEMARKLARVVTLSFVAQFAVGVLNLTLLAPIGMQLVHLLLADVTWIALVLMGWQAWRQPKLEASSQPSDSALAST